MYDFMFGINGTPGFAQRFEAHCNHTPVPVQQNGDSKKRWRFWATFTVGLVGWQAIGPAIQETVVIWFSKLFPGG